MNEESFKPERMPVSRTEAIEALRNFDTDAGAQETFNRWIDEWQKEIDAIYEHSDPDTAALASVKWAIVRAGVYRDAGMLDIAGQELADALDAAGSDVFKGTGLYEEVLDAFRSVESKKMN